MVLNRSSFLLRSQTMTVLAPFRITMIDLSSLILIFFSIMLSSEKEGWIVPTREPQTMAEAIEAFVNMPLQKIEEVRLAARKKVEQQHSLQQMIEEMDALYYEVVDFLKP